MTADVYRTSFSRNIGILTEAEQDRLRSACVAIAGLGGIGSNVVMTLARMGVGRFHLADFDTFELVNVNRQFGAGVDTKGRPKVEVIAEELRRVNPSVEIELFADGFTEDNGDELLEGASLAVDAVDFYSIETHLAFHRKTREHGLYTLMGSPVGFSACLQVFDPEGMNIEEYCGILPEMSPLEKQLRYACGLVPELAHIEYFDVSTGASNTDFVSGTGPSLACACNLAASLVAAEAAILILGRRPPRAIPHTFQFDPYTFRYEATYIEGGMSRYDPAPMIERIPDRASLVPSVLEFLYEKSRARKADVNGARLYYKQEGEGDPVVLVSPLGADSTFWARQIPDLARRHRVISYDARGSGVSSSAPADCTTDVLADDLVILLEQLGVERAHLVGLALGGLVAQQVAVRRPDVVASLVLVSCYAVADDRIRALTAMWRETALNEGMDALFRACLPSLLSARYIEANRGELEKVETFFRLTRQAPSDFCRQSLAGVTHDARSSLNRITRPTLVVHGDGDKVVDVEHARALSQALPDARLTVLRGAPHFLTWEQAGGFNTELFRFLEHVVNATAPGRGR